MSKPSEAIMMVQEDGSIALFIYGPDRYVPSGQTAEMARYQSWPDMLRFWQKVEEVDYKLYNNRARYIMRVVKADPVMQCLLRMNEYPLTKG